MAPSAPSRKQRLPGYYPSGQTDQLRRSGHSSVPSGSSRPTGENAREVMSHRRRSIVGDTPRGDISRSRPASGTDVRVRSAISVFDVFFDLPHPGASRDSDRARMIEPPEVANPEILAHLCDAAAISRLARFAFPEHDDHKHALALQAAARMMPSRARATRRNSSNYMTERSEPLNSLDFYILGFRSKRHTFTLELPDGETKLYCHCLRYLPHHTSAKARSDVGRRGARAMVIITRAVGGDGFYTALLKSIEAAMIQGDSLGGARDFDDSARERAMRMLHGIHRQHVKKFSETMLQLQRSRDGALSELDDEYLTLSAVEFDVRLGGYIQDRVLPGDYIKFQLPPSLQAGFRLGAGPDDIDAPVLPLLRTLGAENTVRVISALLCERRLVFVSEDLDKLSTCVRGIASLLAQGNLIWRYNLAPVLPPHLLSLLADEEPYVVGLLDDFLKDISLLQTLTNVLCVNLDKNQFKTFGMSNPSVMIPDILTKSGKETVAHILYNDMQQILKAETRIWSDGKGSAEEKPTVTVATPINDAVPKKKKGRGKDQDLEVDSYALFNRVMRGESLMPSKSELEAMAVELDDATEHGKFDGTSGHIPRTNGDFSLSESSTNLETFDVCENSRGEEGVRAALTFFFLVTHGDIGAILSEGSRGGFLLDRKKYLLHKKKQGHKETSPLFSMFKTFSGSSMLENHLSQRLEEFDRGKSLLMPRHRSLFTLCEKHLRIKKLEFSYANIRAVVSQTTLHSPLHSLVERSEIARARALTVTSAQPFEGNVAQALSALIQDCHQCDTSLPQTMAVVWSRLDDKKAGNWKHPLLGLHLLKNLLLHGPISILSFALDGIDKVRSLRFFDNSRDENNKEIQELARIVWDLIVDTPRLLQQRGLVLALRAKLVDSTMNERWGNYLIKKVPFNTGFRQYHTLLRPRSYVEPSFMKDHPTPIDMQELEIMRMKLRPLDESITSSMNAAAELKRLKDLQSERQSLHDNGKSRGRNDLSEHSGHSNHNRPNPQSGSQVRASQRNSMSGGPATAVGGGGSRSGKMSPRNSMSNGPTAGESGGPRSGRLSPRNSIGNGSSHRSSATTPALRKSSISNGSYQPSSSHHQQEQSAPASRKSSISNGKYQPSTSPSQQQSSAPVSRKSSISNGSYQPSSSQQQHPHQTSPQKFSRDNGVGVGGGGGPPGGKHGDVSNNGMIRRPQPQRANGGGGRGTPSSKPHPASVDRNNRRASSSG